MTHDDDSLDRRDFVKTSAVAALGFAATGRSPAPLFAPRRSPAEKVVVAVCGVNSRGVVHAQNFSRLRNSEIAYICDVDSNVIAKAMKAATGEGATREPKALGDFRRALDDKAVDA